MFKSKLSHFIFFTVAAILVAFSIQDLADGSLNGDRTKTIMKWAALVVFSILSIDHFLSWWNWDRKKKN